MRCSFAVQDRSMLVGFCASCLSSTGSCAAQRGSQGTELHSGPSGAVSGPCTSTPEPGRRLKVSTSMGRFNVDREMMPALSVGKWKFAKTEPLTFCL